MSNPRGKLSERGNVLGSALGRGELSRGGGMSYNPEDTSPDSTLTLATLCISVISKKVYSGEAARTTGTG